MGPVSTMLSGGFAPPAPLDLRIVFISSYPPRRCGIGTYTKDLVNSINNLNPDRLVEIIALDNKISESLHYPWEVSRRIRQNEWSDYESALDYLNSSIVDVVCIQHEFGIYGGKDGQFIADFVKRLKKPYLVTFHTVLDRPSDNQKRIVQELTAGSCASIVMLSVAADILREIYSVNPEKIMAIHHGTPDFPFAPNGMKKKYRLEGRTVMSSVNLISPDKGIEYAIQALPAIVKKHPDFIYLVIGQTHPVIISEIGEVYREKLKKLVRDLKLTKHVRFVNEYVPLEELIDYVMASDFYITPYSRLDQISSGALAYAIAAGKICISTPYRYAHEMLAGGRGYLVEPKNPDAITKATLRGISHKAESDLMREKAYSLGRRMIWARVGFRYLRVLEHLLSYRQKPTIYPRPSLSYLRVMTNEIGLVEHSDHDSHNYKEGYSVDDASRGLVAAIQYGDKKLADQYLGFIIKSESGGKIYCDADETGSFYGEPGVGDWFGRTFWAAAYAMRHGQTLALRKRASELMRKMIPQAYQAASLRTFAFILIGLVCLKELEWDELTEEQELLRTQALEFIRVEFKKHHNPNWRWPAANITYDNPRIAQALIEVGIAWDDPELKEFGMELLNFVLDHTFDILENHFRFVGNKGWYKKGGIPAHYDEQPIEAGSTVQACYAAYRASGVAYYRDMAKKAFAWYHGDNIMRRPLFNPKRQSVFDGLNEGEINPNQGAESILEYLLAYTCYATLIEEGFLARDFAYSPQPTSAAS